MAEPTDFNDLRDPERIRECLARAQPAAELPVTVGDVQGVVNQAEQGAETSPDPNGITGLGEFAQAVSALAEMGQVEYDRARKQVAKSLNVRLATLDSAVEKARERRNPGLAPGLPAHALACNHTNYAAGRTEEAPAHSNGVPPEFMVTHAGVFHRSAEAVQDGSEATKICSELHITALVRDPAWENWGRVLEFKDADGVLHQWVMPMTMLAGDGVELRSELVRQGLEIMPGNKARQRLAEYIMSCRPQARGRCVNKTGWFGGQFVLPDRTLGVGTEVVRFQSEKAALQYAQAGTIDDWKQQVAALAAGNSRVVLALCAAFAGPLLHLVGAESGGINFVGSSSIGKSTLLQVAASAFGGPGYIQTWRATGNGLEGLCALHNDGLLVLDELGEVDAREAGSIAYMIGNGAGKTRADRHGEARTPKTWRVMYLSSGEVSLAQHMAESGKAARAGQEVRLIDLPADAGAGLGIFETLHGFEQGGDLANALKDATRKSYGTVGLAYIESIAADVGELPGKLKGVIAGFVQEFLPENAGGQAARVTARFGIMAAAGEIATHYGLTGWAPGAAKQAAAQCLRVWLDHRGGAGDRERDVILAQVRSYFESHGDARFTDVGDPDRTTPNRAGFRKMVDGRQEFYVLSEAYKRELCAGFSQRTVTKVLQQAGWLQAGKDGKSSQKKSLPGIGETRVYVIDSTMFKEGNDVD